MTITVVTPWVDHLELAEDYFAAIEAGKPDELIVVDNGSDPPLDFAAVRLETNEGFTKGCNAGLNAATCDAVLFLNNDIALRFADWLDRIRDAVEPGVLVGTRIRYDKHGDVNGQSYPYIDGWLLAGMRDELLDLGGFDETFQEPAYYSDNDLCLRARLNGLRLREVKVGLYHKTSATSGGAANPDVPEAIRVNYKKFSERAREAVAA